MTTLRIELEIDGSEDDALYVVSRLLDGGDLQDAIRDHDFDAGPLQVISAEVTIRRKPQTPAPTAAERTIELFAPPPNPQQGLFG